MLHADKRTNYRLTTFKYSNLQVNGATMMNRPKVKHPSMQLQSPSMWSAVFGESTGLRIHVEAGLYSDPTRLKSDKMASLYAILTTTRPQSRCQSENFNACWQDPSGCDAYRHSVWRGQCYGVAAAPPPGKKLCASLGLNYCKQYTARDCVISVYKCSIVERRLSAYCTVCSAASVFNIILWKSMGITGVCLGIYSKCISMATEWSLFLAFHSKKGLITTTAYTYTNALACTQITTHPHTCIYMPLASGSCIIVLPHLLSNHKGLEPHPCSRL